MKRDKLDDGSKYRKSIKGVDVDVYDILAAFDIRCPATQHAIKKLLAAGKRGHKSAAKDLAEAQWSIGRAIELSSHSVTKIQ